MTNQQNGHLSIIPFCEHGLVTIGKDVLGRIEARLPEYRRASYVVGHSKSQTSLTLQTLAMVSDSPLSRMKQCLSQIHHKYEALREAHFKVEHLRLDITELDTQDTPRTRLDAADKRAQVASIEMSMENALRLLGMFQDMYEEIRASSKVPENWTEADFEAQEVEHMIRSSFRLGVQDIMMTGRVSRGCTEWWEQLGIHPTTALVHVQNYLAIMDAMILKADKEPSVELMHKFLDDMVKKFGESYKVALARIGLSEIGSERFMAAGLGEMKS
jgi:hypothetical protein